MAIVLKKRRSTSANTPDIGCELRRVNLEIDVCNGWKADVSLRNAAKADLSCQCLQWVESALASVAAPKD